jgi:hypothetical protein
LLELEPDMTTPNVNSRAKSSLNQLLVIVIGFYEMKFDILTLDIPSILG